MALIRLLGPVDVVDDDGNVRGSTSAIRRTLLALFAIHAGRVLSTDWLLEHGWNGQAPESGHRALRFHISQLRRELGGLDLVETCPGGYRLRVAPGDVDMNVVESLGRAARDETDDSRAARLCAQALASWRGEPFIDASPTSELADETARLDELRLSLTELGYRRRLDAGEGAELIAELVRLTGDHPLRETLWQVLIAAQYRTGRQADALRSYDAVRSLLVETLGVEPSPELQELHRRVLNQDPTLSAASTRASVLMLWDVEGATGLLVRRGQAGIAMLADVAELVAVVARGRGGRVSSSQGERGGAVVLFGSVADAVGSSLEVNKRMAEERWQDGELIAVRSAIHVGDVTVTADGVFGSEVHRCAGLRALADDGEVFLSEAAVRTAGQPLPDDSSVVDEGPIVLPGSAEPEHVWRLVHPALRSRQRPVLRPAASQATLPVWRTSFVGRSQDVATVSGLLDVGRLVTLVGPAGVGKTRLAAAVAAERDGRRCFVDLSAATKDGEVDALVAEALGSSPGAAPRSGIEEVLRAAPTLVVLDNCEQVLDAVASLVEHVLVSCEGSLLLATSRSPLRVPDEDVFAVAPLVTGTDGAAIQLFVDRAGATRGELTANGDVLAQIGAVTTLLDGVPLAIELAAARVTAFSVAEILTLLHRDLVDLGDSRRRGPDRHRTVRAAIEWSMRLLSHDERRLLCRLAMLPGTFRLSTAIAVTGTGGGESRELAAALPALVEQSLVTPEHRNGPTRYRLLEMIRSVARDALSASEQKEVLDRLLVHCLDQVRGLDSPNEREAGTESEIVRDTALYSTSIEHALATDQIESGLRLVYHLFAVWHSGSQRSNLDRWMNDLLARSETPSAMRAMVLRRQAILASEDLGDDERAMRLLDDAEGDAAAVDDRQLLGRIRATRAGLDLDRQRFDGLETRFYDAIALLEETGDSSVAETLYHLAELYAMRAQFDQANELLNRAEAANPPWYVRFHIELSRAMCALTMGLVEPACEHAAKALDMAERSEDPDPIAEAVGIAALAALARGETAVATELFLRMLAVTREHEFATQTDALVGLAIVSVARGDLNLARSCRDELRCRQQSKRWTYGPDIPRGRLACAFVDLADGDADRAAAAASDVLADAERQHHPYAHLLSLELVAASVAANDPQRAKDLLAVAAAERTAIGAPAWPLEPYRDAALRTLDDPAADGPA